MKKGIDLNGKVFGKWTVLNHVIKSTWLCLCQCGNKEIIARKYLIGGTATRCTKCRKIERTEGLIGKQFRLWTVISVVMESNLKQGGHFFNCQCSCGAMAVISGTNLRHGRTSRCNRCKLRIGDGEAAFNHVYGYYQKNAKKRALSFELSKDEFRKITTSNCYYTNLPPSLIHKTPGCEYIYNGIDRLDNNIGYTINNSVSCNPSINRMKMGLPYSEFIDLCNLVAQRFSGKILSAENELKNNLKIA